MKTTQIRQYHKINNCVKNAYHSIMAMRAVENIWTAYKSPSIYKVRAWEWCIADCRENNGYGLCVTGWNTSKFTCAYFCKHYKTGERCIVVHTADNVYWCYVTELDN